MRRTARISGVVALMAAMCSAALAEQNSGGWNDYQIIVWQRETPAAYATLRKIGVTGAAMLADRDDPDAIGPAVADLQRAGMRQHRRQRRLHGGELLDQQRHQRIAGCVPIRLSGLSLG